MYKEASATHNKKAKPLLAQLVEHLTVVGKQLAMPAVIEWSLVPSAPGPLRSTTYTAGHYN